MFDLIYWIVFIPLFGTIINGLFGKPLDRWNRNIIHWVGCGSIAISLFLAFIVFFKFLSLPHHERVIEKVLYSWIVSGDLAVQVAYRIDPLSVVMMMVVLGVGFLIHIYSIGYMIHDPDYPRYFTYLNLFIFMMLNLVLSNNLLLMFFGWEGVGLCSYLLIGFWFEKDSASNAGKKAFIVNRIGDYGFTLGMFTLFAALGSKGIWTLRFEDIFHHVHLLSPEIVTIIALLLFVGATGKSAQIPLYVWLPDAMEGPTPVSSLIHAATMVTAGVYMVSRMSPLYVLTPTAMKVVAVIGALTAFFAATMALCQFDLKKILAYSTISQLGYMFLACGVGAFAAGIFHVMTHAFFKALLFMGAGSVMHAMEGELDFRVMGGLKKKMPITYWTMLMATLAIAGIPGFSGFFSKDEILANAFFSPRGSFILWFIGFVTAGLTAFYMFRLVFNTFHGECRAPEELKKHIHEAPPSMTVPMIILAILSVIGGYVGVPKILGGANHFHHFLEPAIAPLPEMVHHAHHVSLAKEWALMILSVIAALTGIVVAYIFYLKNREIPVKLAERFPTLYRLLYNKWYVDEIYMAIIVNPLKRLANFLWKDTDVAVIDGSVNGVAGFVKSFGSVLREWETGQLQHYILTMLIGIFVVITYFLVVTLSF